MACNICLAPILVHPSYLNPKDASHITQTDHLTTIVPRLFPRDKYGPFLQNGNYYQDAVLLTESHEEVVLKNLEYQGRGFFLGDGWLISGGCYVARWQEELDDNGRVGAVGCLKILCWRLGVPFDLKNVDTLVAIMEQHLFLGMTERGGYRSAGIDYSEGEMNKRWLTTLSRRKDSAKFLFKYKSGKHDWALQRPDIFPRLVREVTRERMRTCAKVAPQTDFLTSCPHLVFLNIASFLDIPSLYNLTAVSKRLRFRCLLSIDFQSIVRDALFQTWACPSPAEEKDTVDYEMVIAVLSGKSLGQAWDTIAAEGHPVRKAIGDWLGYGSEVFKSPNMKNRRRIFRIITQLRQKSQERAEKLGYLNGPESERRKRNFRALIEHQMVLANIAAKDSTRFALCVEITELFNEVYPKIFAGGRSVAQGPLLVDLETGHLLVEAVEVAKRRIKEEDERIAKVGGGSANPLDWLESMRAAITRHLQIRRFPNDAKEVWVLPRTP